MSLTSFLESSPHVRDYLRTTFPKPAPVRRAPLLVPPRSSNPSWIGTAFDYALRWTMLTKYPIAKDKAQWIAEAAVERIDPRSRYFAPARASVRRARTRVKRAVRTGTISGGLLHSALELAKLDPIFRAGVGHEYIVQPVEEAAVAELRELLDLVPHVYLRPRRRCLLNPTLTASREIGGADVDFLIDDMLLEIKTTRSGKCERAFFNQLLGYYLLNLEAGVREMPRRPSVRRLAIYFSRQAHLHTWSLLDIADAAQFEAARRWFMQQVHERYGTEWLRTYRRRPGLAIRVRYTRPGASVDRTATPKKNR